MGEDLCSVQILKSDKKRNYTLSHIPNEYFYSWGSQQTFFSPVFVCLISALKMPTVSDPKKEQSGNLICEFIHSTNTKRIRNVTASWCACALRERKTEAVSKT